ncbi:hypothetical protein EYF80_007223 [Liparis tanakae]|uniref:Uncharacterized protein n=1 Tax=Liparis tanakae TaxID=230148 RepID=A0A4Z2IY23_9TELE|nr:hypothetical protein EYF80_007223 [Liparis tanakae]
MAVPGRDPVPLSPVPPPSARPMPPGHCREGTRGGGGLPRIGLNYNRGTAAHCHGSDCGYFRKQCSCLYAVACEAITASTRVH